MTTRRRWGPQRHAPSLHATPAAARRTHRHSPLRERGSASISRSVARRGSQSGTRASTWQSAQRGGSASRGRRRRRRPMKTRRLLHCCRRDRHRRRWLSISSASPPCCGDELARDVMVLQGDSGSGDARVIAQSETRTARSAEQHFRLSVWRERVPSAGSNTRAADERRRAARPDIDQNRAETRLKAHR